MYRSTWCRRLFWVYFCRVRSRQGRGRRRYGRLEVDGGGIDLGESRTVAVKLFGIDQRDLASVILVVSAVSEISSARSVSSTVTLSLALAFGLGLSLSLIPSRGMGFNMGRDGSRCPTLSGRPITHRSLGTDGEGGRLVSMVVPRGRRGDV